MSEYRFKAEVTDWSGHGEGGKQVQVVLDKSYATWNATADDIAEAERDAEALNRLTAEVANLKRLLEEGGRRVELMLIPALTKNISGVVTPEASEAWVKEVKQALSTDSGRHQP